MGTSMTPAGTGWLGGCSSAHGRARVRGALPHAPTARGAGPAYAQRALKMVPRKSIHGHVGSVQTSP